MGANKPSPGIHIKEKRGFHIMGTNWAVCYHRLPLSMLGLTLSLHVVNGTSGHEFQKHELDTDRRLPGLNIRSWATFARASERARKFRNGGSVIYRFILHKSGWLEFQCP